MTLTDLAAAMFDACPQCHQPHDLCTCRRPLPTVTPRDDDPRIIYGSTGRLR